MVTRVSTPSAERLIFFNITDSIKRAGISELTLNKEFIFKFNNGGMASATFCYKSDSTPKIMRRINQSLKNRLEEEYKISALQDIERQLIERHDEIFKNKKSSKSTRVAPIGNMTKIEEQIRNTRQQIKENNIGSQEWHTILSEKYSKLEQVVASSIPELWLPLECLISLNTILHIKNWTLPLMIILLGVPSSLKTVALEMFCDYPNTFSTDDFTPSSFVSHMSGKSEEELQEDDMLPKMINKLCIFPELAPIFSAKDEDFRKIVSKFLRLLDGKGFKSDSGAAGHRGYSGELMFVAGGAAVEVSYHVYRIFGNLGQKIYFLRLPKIDKSREERKEDVKQKNDFKKRVKKIRDFLFDYLIWLESAPESVDLQDDNGHIKFEWDAKKEDEIEQDTALGYLVDVGDLLAHLRGVVNTYESKSTRTSHHRTGGQEANNDSVSESQLNFENDFSIIEESQRAITHLKSLAMGHAISRGRNYLTKEDIPIIIKVALSSTSIGRVRIFDLLLENKGELLASEICKKLKVSPHTAHRIMTELDALEIVDMSSVATYSSSERIIKLKENFRWFLSAEFQQLREGFRPADYTKLKYKINTLGSNEGLDTKNNDKIEECDNNSACDGHTNEENLSPGNGENNSDDKSRSDSGSYKQSLNTKGDQQFTEVKSDGNSGTTNNQQSSLDSLIDQENNSNALKSGEENCKHVTVTRSQESPLSDVVNHNLVLKEVLETIKGAKGSQISFNAAIESACSRNQSVRSYLGDKLTSRENKKVRKLAEIFHLYRDNIEVVKTRPQIILRWIEATDSDDNPASAT